MRRSRIDWNIRAAGKSLAEVTLRVETTTDGRITLASDDDRLPGPIRIRPQPRSHAAAVLRAVASDPVATRLRRVPWLSWAAVAPVADRAPILAVVGSDREVLLGVERLVESFRPRYTAETVRVNDAAALRAIVEAAPGLPASAVPTRLVVVGPELITGSARRHTSALLAASSDALAAAGVAVVTGAETLVEDSAYAALRRVARIVASTATTVRSLASALDTITEVALRLVAEESRWATRVNTDFVLASR